MLVNILITLAAYLLGSIPSGYLLVKYVYSAGEDVRQIGSGATGATNVVRRAGLTAGVLTLLIDVAKGAVAVMLMRLAAGEDYAWLGTAGLAAVAGHIFPVFLGFRGGKGVATGLGVFLLLAPVPVSFALAVFLMTVAATRYMSLASILATATVPVATLILYGWVWPHAQLAALVITTLAASTLIIAKHHENISRLLAGTESRFGERIRPTNPGGPSQSAAS